MSSIADMCKVINNTNKAGHRKELIRRDTPEMRKFIDEMRKQGYVGRVSFISDNASGKTVIELNGRLNKCGAICPHYSVLPNEMEMCVGRILPARQFGHVVFETEKGVLCHRECQSALLRGNVLGYFY